MSDTFDFFKERSVRYLNKDFASFKRDLMRFSQAHHSGVFQDFNESSPGMAILEWQAYVGDVLSFYLDQSFNELKDDTARQLENVVSFAKARGYRPKGKRSARGTQAFFIEVPATTSDGQVVPDDSYAPSMRMGAKCDGPNGVIFETLDDVDFASSTADSPRAVTGSRFDSVTGQPTHFAIRKTVDVIAGETKSTSFSVREFQQFLTLEIPDEDVIEVLSVEDSDGNRWYEVDHLAQEMVYDAVTNSGEDSSVVPYVLKFRTVPRRFITDRDPSTRKTSLVFGSGDGVNFDDELIPNLADLALPLPGRRTFSSFAIDPQNFLKTQTLGLSPFDTTLDVAYRVGGGEETNVPARSISSVREASLDFSVTGLDPAKKSDVVSSLQTVNPDKTEGGGGEETISEIKANSAAFFAAQDRVVTRADFIVRAMSLPEKFGKVEKAFVKTTNLNTSAVDIHILTIDQDGHLAQASQTLMSNVATYLGQYRMLTDSLNVLQTDILNIKVEFGVVVSPKMNKTEVKAKCLSVVADYFALARMNVGSPILLSDLEATIQSVFGVASVYRLSIKSLFGRQEGAQYSPSSIDVSAWTSNKILYCPENSIFEVKYLTRDIVAEAK